MSPHVRPASPADAAALRTLQRHLDEPAPALLDAALSGVVGDLLVAEAGDPVGYLLAVDAPPDVATAHLPDADQTVHVAELVVDPAARRQGHASALLATLLGMHPAAAVTLTVAADNDAARSLYDQFGFEVQARLPAYFDDGAGLLLVHRWRPE